jgi:hypothetical protein
MYKTPDAFQEGLRRFLAEGGFTWVERQGPPPLSCVKILKNMHPPRTAERLCEEGFPLVYIAAVRRREDSPLEEACHRGDAICYVYGDVEWAPELEEKCKPVTFYVDIKEEKRALEALLLYIAKTRSLPWLVFNRDVLRIVGLCDAAPNICLTEEAVIKKVEAMRRQSAAQPPRGVVADAVQDTAETQADATPQQAAQKTESADGPHAAVRLDPAVLELLRRCCGEDCVSRLLACRG